MSKVIGRLIEEDLQLAGEINSRLPAVYDKLKIEMQAASYDDNGYMGPSFIKLDGVRYNGVRGVNLVVLDEFANFIDFTKYDVHDGTVTGHKNDIDAINALITKIKSLPNGYTILLITTDQPQYPRTSNIYTSTTGPLNKYLTSLGFTMTDAWNYRCAWLGAMYIGTGVPLVESFHFQGITNEVIEIPKGLIHYPMDDDAQSIQGVLPHRYCPKKIRYIRDWANGSSAHADTHWTEIEAYNFKNENVALYKRVIPMDGETGIGRSNTSIDVITDGDTSGISSEKYFQYFGNKIGAVYVTVDLLQPYELSKLKIFHYHQDSRHYFETKTEVSEDGKTWYTVFDSVYEGEYIERPDGHTINLFSSMPITPTGIDISEKSTNILSPQSTVARYLNNTSDISFTLKVLDETYNDQPIYRVGFTPLNATGLNDMKDSGRGHGVYVIGNTEFKANTFYSKSIFWRPVNKPRMKLDAMHSNIGAWNRYTEDIQYESNWRRSIYYRNDKYTEIRRDSIYFSISTQDLKVGETVYTDFTCPQLEEGKKYASSYKPQSGSNGGLEMKYKRINVLPHQEYSIYNNHPSVIKSTLEVLTEKYKNAQIVRIGFHVTEEFVPTFRKGTWSFGIRTKNIEKYPNFFFEQGTPYCKSIIWRPVNKADIFVSTEPSNIGMWTTHSMVEDMGSGWKRTSGHMYATSSKSDSLFFSLGSPTATAGETIYIDFTCMQLEENTISPSPYHSLITDSIFRYRGLKLPLSVKQFPFSINMQVDPHIRDGSDALIGREAFMMYVATIWKDSLLGDRFVGLINQTRRAMLKDPFMITWVFESSTICKTYINGVFSDNATSANVLFAMNRFFENTFISIGARDVPTDIAADAFSYANATYKDISIYNRVLTPQEMQKLYKSQFGFNSLGDLRVEQIQERPISIPVDATYFPLNEDAKSSDGLAQGEYQEIDIFSSGTLYADRNYANLVPTPITFSDWGKSTGLSTSIDIGPKGYRDALKIVSTNKDATDNYIRPNNNLTQNISTAGTFTLSIWLKSDKDRRIRIILTNNNNVSLEKLYVDFDVTTKWKKYTHTYTSTTTERKILYIGGWGSWKGTGEISVAYPQITISEVELPFVDGISGDLWNVVFNFHRDLGLRWNEDWTIGVFRKNSGYYSTYANSSIGGMSTLDGNTKFANYFWFGLHNKGINFQMGGKYVSVTNIPQHKLGEWYVQIISKRGDGISAYYLPATGDVIKISDDGTSRGKIDTENFFVHPNGFDFNLSGWYYDYNNVCKSYFKDLFVLKRAITDEEIKNFSKKMSFSNSNKTLSINGVLKEDVDLV